MAGMTEPRELFVHELGDLLFAEQSLVKTLPTLAKESSDAELKAGFEAHLDETKQHVENLKSVFELIGEQPKAEKCPGIEGIKKEHDEFMAQEEPSPEVCDIFLTGAGSRAEHYEIAAYEGLITLAQGLGHEDAVPLLRENLGQEQDALEKLEKMGKKLASATSAPTR
jgi:ferritin-like metal-binding protein YciE